MVGRMQGNPVDYCGYGDTLLVSDSFFEQVSEGREGLYAFAIGAVPKETKERAELIRACYGEQGGMRFTYAGAMSTELEAIEKTMENVSGIFTLVSVVLALFALFVFYQFMVTSMEAKKREIGIMRSMGATKKDIYRIFGLESGLAAAVMFVLGTLLTVLCVKIGNGALQDEIGIGTTVLHFGFRQILLLLVFALLGALVAGILPIRRMMKKKPVELIRDL